MKRRIFLFFVIVFFLVNFRSYGTHTTGADTKIVEMKQSIGFKKIALISVTKTVDFGASSFASSKEVNAVIKILSALTTNGSSIVQSSANVSSNDIAESALRLWKEQNKDALCLIVFNEMLFSKERPLSCIEKSDIQSKFIELSKLDANVVFFLNFLFTEEQLHSEKEMNENLQKMKIPGSAVNCDDPLMMLTIDAMMQQYNAANLSAQIKCSALVNKTVAIGRGEELLYHKKAVYCNESNASFVSRSVHYYDFGDGLDHVVTNNKQAVFAKALQDNISMEICYELCCGTRKANNWTNDSKASKLHMIQANYVDLYNAWLNWPVEEYIMYVDPHYFSANPMWQCNHNLNSLCFAYNKASNQTMFYKTDKKISLSIKICDSIYTISIIEI